MSNGGQRVPRQSLNGQPDDRFTILKQGSAAGKIDSPPGANLTYGGVVIGTRSGGTGASPLVITFNANATGAAIQALIRNIQGALLQVQP